jgi:hypothetical protein
VVEGEDEEEDREADDIQRPAEDLQPVLDRQGEPSLAAGAAF